MNRQEKTARALIVIIFLALIRCIAEPFRLQHYAARPLGLEEVKAYLIGALAAAAGLFVMTLCSFYKRPLITIVTGIATLISLFVIKWLYLGF